jgi:hypothetical protein
VLTIRDALDHTVRALRQLKDAKGSAQILPGAPGADPVMSRDLLLRAQHELASALEAVREELVAAGAAPAPPSVPAAAPSRSDAQSMRRPPLGTRWNPLTMNRTTT